jgi:hypothetical protein
MSWTEETVKDIWDTLEKDNDRYKYTAFDNEREDIINKNHECAASQMNTFT